MPPEILLALTKLYRSLKLGPYAYLRGSNWQAVREEYLPHLLGFAGLIAALLIHSVAAKILVNVRTRQITWGQLARQLDLEKEARISRTRLSPDGACGHCLPTVWHACP